MFENQSSKELHRSDDFLLLDIQNSLGDWTASETKTKDYYKILTELKLQNTTLITVPIISRQNLPFHHYQVFVSLVLKKKKQ